MDVFFCPTCGSLMQRHILTKNKNIFISSCKKCETIHVYDSDTSKFMKFKIHSEIVYRYTNKDYHYIYLYYLNYYLPKIKFKQNKFSEMILKFKQENVPSTIIKMFALAVIGVIVAKRMCPDIIIPIPSSLARKISLGHKLLVDYVAKNLGIINGTGILMRIKNITPAHLSEARPSVNEHYKTIRCTGEVSNMKVILFDDIYTTGNTAMACIRRVIEAGAKRVDLITLGRTVKVR